MYSTNKCDLCQIKKICKHYQYFKLNDDIRVEVKDCENIRYNQTFGASISQPVDVKPTQSQVALLNNTGKVYPDLKEEYIPNISVKEIATPIEISKVVCDRCKKEVPSTEIDNCVECGRPVCKDCGVGALNDGKPEFTCEKCWSGTPDPDPNSSEEVVITYGEEKKEWDIEDFIENEDKKEEKKDEPREQVDNGKPTRKSKKK